MIIEEADRLKNLPPYLFAEIDRVIKEKRSNGIDVISLGIGDPDMPTPEPIIEALYKAARDNDNHRYPSSYGLLDFKRSISSFYKRRFGVDLDPENEIITLIGSKTAIANMAYTYINPGDLSIVPDPAYLVYSIGTMFAGGKSFKVPLLEKNDFLLDIDSIDSITAENAKLFYINYPNNPTSATCDIDFFNKIVNFAKEHKILVCHDNAYSDIFEDPDNKPISFLNAKGAKDVGIEINSLSKTFNMTGWRLAYAVGNSEVIQSLGKYKTNVDSGAFNAVQFAGKSALDGYESFINKNNAIYTARKNMVKSALDKLSINYFDSDATIYIWSKVPEGYTSTSFAKMLLEKADVVVTPGSAFGDSGEGFFRISLTISDDRLEEAISRIGKVL